MKGLKPYTKEWLEELCKESHTYTEVMLKAGRQPSGGNHSYLKKKIETYGIDVSHFTRRIWNKGLTQETDARVHGVRTLTHDIVFIEDSVIQRRDVRRIVLRDKLLPYICSFCHNQGEWLGQPMSLELDHINGNSTDNRLSNLRWLCPNCHAITPTYCGKKNKGD